MSLFQIAIIKNPFDLALLAGLQFTLAAPSSPDYPIETWDPERGMPNSSSA